MNVNSVLIKIHPWQGTSWSCINRVVDPSLHIPSTLFKLITKNERAKTKLTNLKDGKVTSLNAFDIISFFSCLNLLGLFSQAYGSVDDGE